MPVPVRTVSFLLAVRHDFGASYLSMLVTARENDGGGYNRVAGPNFLWRRSETDQMTGQLLVSDTETPDRPDLYSGWDGRRLTSHAGHLEWLHTGRDWTWRATIQDFGEDFRADEGFVPQVGYRSGRYALYRNYYREQGLFRRISPYTVVRYIESPDGELIRRQTNPGVQVNGRRNMAAGIDFAVREQLRVGRQVLERSDVNWYFQYDPGRRFCAESGSFAGSALFAYQINWQTVLFVGYADDRAQDPAGDLQPADRLLFLKVSYAFQR